MANIVVILGIVAVAVVAAVYARLKIDRNRRINRRMDGKMGGD